MICTSINVKPQHANNLILIDGIKFLSRKLCHDQVDIKHKGVNMWGPGELGTLSVVAKKIQVSYVYIMNIQQDHLTGKIKSCLCFAKINELNLKVEISIFWKIVCHWNWTIRLTIMHFRFNLELHRTDDYKMITPKREVENINSESHKYMHNTDCRNRRTRSRLDIEYFQ